MWKLTSERYVFKRISAALGAAAEFEASNMEEDYAYEFKPVFDHHALVGYTVEVTLATTAQPRLGNIGAS